MRIYLAHPTSDRIFVYKEVQPVLEKAGFDVVNPFLQEPQRAKIFLDESLTTVEALAKEKEVPGLSDPCQIVHMEQEMIQTCDIVVAVVTKSSIGMAMEILYSAEILHKPVYIIGYRNYDKHPWLRHYTTTTTNPEELIELIKSRSTKP